MGWSKTFRENLEDFFIEALKTTKLVAPLGSDSHGAPTKEEWYYALIIVIILYLLSNPRMEILFAVY